MVIGIADGNSPTIYTYNIRVYLHNAPNITNNGRPID